MDWPFSPNESIVERMKRLGDSYRTALVTGGTSGLGLAFCEMLTAEGVEVTTVSRRPERLSETKGLRNWKLDLSDAKAIRAFTDEYLSSSEIPDLLVNNAGYGAFFEWGEFPEEEIVRQIEVLFTTPVRLCRTFASVMAERGSGGIVNVSSIAGLFPLPYMPVYNAAKAGLSAFSASLSLEYKEAPFVTDFRLGDFRTNFNEAASKGGVVPSDSSRGRVWSQIEKQLDASPEPIVAARALRRILRRKQGGVTYAGGFGQVRMAPLFARLAPAGLVRTVLRWRYRLSGQSR